MKSRIDLPIPYLNTNIIRCFASDNFNEIPCVATAHVIKSMPMVTISATPNAMLPSVEVEIFGIPAIYQVANAISSSNDLSLILKDSYHRLEISHHHLVTFITIYSTIQFVDHDSTEASDHPAVCSLPLSRSQSNEIETVLFERYEYLVNQVSQLPLGE